MKKALLFLIGWIPLLLGIVMNGWMIRFMDMLPPYTLIALGLLLVWAWAGALSVRLGAGRWPSLLLLNLPAALSLLLLLLQELVLGQYWVNMLGMGTQLFFLPLVNPSSRLLMLVLHNLSMPPVHIVSFLLLCGASGLGRYLGERKNDV